MTSLSHAVRAYQSAAEHRSLRAQEADIFRQAVGALKSARDADAFARTRALADNRRLWLAVNDLMRDPSNALPPTLRSAIISVGITVQREMEKPEPDFGFLIGINENIAAGLSGEP